MLRLQAASKSMASAHPSVEEGELGSQHLIVSTEFKASGGPTGAASAGGHLTISTAAGQKVKRHTTCAAVFPTRRPRAGRASRNATQWRAGRCAGRFPGISSGAQSPQAQPKGSEGRARGRQLDLLATPRSCLRGWWLGRSSAVRASAARSWLPGMPEPEVGAAEQCVGEICLCRATAVVRSAAGMVAHRDSAATLREPQEQLRALAMLTHRAACEGSSWPQPCRWSICCWSAVWPRQAASPSCERVVRGASCRQPTSALDARTPRPLVQLDPCLLR